MQDSKTKYKKTVSFCPNNSSSQKKQIKIINIKRNNWPNIILKNIKIKNAFKSILINKNPFILKKNYSQDFLDTKESKQLKDKNINKSMINLNSYNKTILVDKRNLFKKKYFNKKHPLYQSQNIYKNSNINNKLINNSMISRSLNHIDSKTLEETKSKLENSNINEISDRIVNESLIEPKNSSNNNKSIKLLLPKLFNSLKKRNKKKNISFLAKSRHKEISATDIYLHYLKENENDKNKIDNQPTIVDFAKYLKNNENKKFNYGFDKIYAKDQSFNNRINEIKKNKNIALKNDFHIEDYQKTLLKLLKKRVSQKFLENLESRYKLFNERNYGMTIPRGRYIALADKLKDFLSKDIFEKVKRMDRNYIIYLEKQEELSQKKTMEIENRNNFYKNLNNTIINFSRKKTII